MTTPDRGPPLAISSDPLKRLPGAGVTEGMKNEATPGAGISSSRATSHEIVEIDGSPSSSLSANHEPNYIKAGSPASVRFRLHLKCDVLSLLRYLISPSCSFYRDVVFFSSNNYHKSVSYLMYTGRSYNSKRYNSC